MPDPLQLTIVAAVAFLASVLSGVAGFGGAMIFLPVLVAVHGARASVPVLTLAVLLGNASRVYFNRGELDLRLAGVFSAGAIPGAILGSIVYVALPAPWITKAIGAFLILSVLGQKFHKPVKINSRGVFAPLGALTGFLSAIIGGVGPFSSPFFLAYGLTKEAFVGTEALCAVGMHVTKSIAYGRLNVLGGPEIQLGLLYGIVMAGGSYTARRILDHLSREKFLVVVESLLVVIGIGMLIR